MTQPQVRPFVKQNRPAVFRQVPLGHHDIASPAERRHGPFRAHQHSPVLQPFATSAADQTQDSDERTKRPQQRGGRPEQECRPGEHLPRKRFGKRFGEDRRNSLPVRDFRQDGDFAVNRDHAQRQHEREEHRPQNHDPVEAVEGLTAQQQFEKEVEDSQADADFQAVNHQVVHGAIGFDFRCGRSGCAVRRARSSPPRPAPRPPRGRNSRNSG